MSTEKSIPIPLEVLNRDPLDVLTNPPKLKLDGPARPAQEPGLTAETIETYRASALLGSGGWPGVMKASDVAVLELCAEVDRLRAERDALRRRVEWQPLDVLPRQHWEYRSTLLLLVNVGGLLSVEMGYWTGEQWRIVSRDGETRCANSAIQGWCELPPLPAAPKEADPR